ncbi:MAG: MFS transporter, partial [Candidatus Saccharimonadales bacterium]
ILGAGALTSALSAAGVGRISFRVGYTRSMLICLAGAMILQIPQAFVTTTTQLFILRMLAGLFLGGAIPSANALIARNTAKEVQGSVYGINTSIGAAGAAIGPAIGASVAVAFGYSETFLATAVVLAGGTLCAIMLGRVERGTGVPAEVGRAVR